MSNSEPENEGGKSIIQQSQPISYLNCGAPDAAYNAVAVK